MGDVVKFKATWVIKGCINMHGVGYDLVHAPISRMPPLGMVPSLADNLKHKVRQLDVGTALLNDLLDDIYYINTPPG